MRVKDFNKWDLQPHLLTDEEIADPMKVVNEVFDYAHLPDLRNTLWEWLKPLSAATSTRAVFTSETGRA